MVQAAIYWVFLIASLASGWIKATRSDRRLIFAIALAAVLTFGTLTLLDQADAAKVIAVIDLSLLCYAIWRSLHTERFWPVWFAGFQTAAILTWLASALVSHANWLIMLLASFWVIPCQVVIVWGTLKDRHLATAQARRSSTVQST